MRILKSSKFTFICLFLTIYFMNMTWFVAIGCNSNSVTKDRKKGLKGLIFPTTKR